MLRRTLGFVRDCVWVGLGWAVYWVRGSTPARAYQAMITLFCRTRGKSSDWMSRVISVVRPPYELPNPEGVLGRFERPQLDAVTRTLREQGYYVFPRRLPDDMCDRLLQYALTHESEVRVTDGGVSRGEVPRRAVYDPTHPLGVRYEFTQQEVINIPDVQALMSDLSIIAVAQDYLQSRPVADVTGLWWHTAFQAAPDKQAAQYFHFDMDRIKWLKFFIYLTDVTADNGPHSFVAGSHRTGGMPDALLSQGYSRLEDRDVEAHFDRQKMIEFTAPRGTILAEDTRGLHKGKHVVSGHRLILQLQFSNSLFGTTYAPARFGPSIDRRLLDVARRYPALYTRFLPGPAGAA